MFATVLGLKTFCTTTNTKTERNRSIAEACIDAPDQNRARSVQEQTSMGGKEWKHGLRVSQKLLSTQRPAADKNLRNGSMDTTRSHVHVVLEARWRPLAEGQDMIMTAV